MNVAKVCRLVPSAMPHEFLGYPKLSLDGMLLTIELIAEVMRLENGATSGSAAADARRAKHAANM